MVYWRFYDFIVRIDRTGLEEWIHTLPRKVRKYVSEEVETRLEYLAHVEEWDRPDTGQLANGLIEIRIKLLRTQYRPICFYGPDRGEVSLLTGAIEKDRALIPPSAVSKATDRKNLILSDRRHVREHIIGKT